MEELENETEEKEDEYLSVDFPQDRYKPGDHVEGTVQWKFAQPAGHIDVSLLLEVVSKVETETIYPAGFRWNDLPEEGLINFSFTLPEGPYTFDGKGFQIRWYVEARCPEFNWTDEVEFTFSPTGAAFTLGKD